MVPNDGVSAMKLESITLDKALFSRIGTIRVTCAVNSKCVLSYLPILAVSLPKGHTSSIQWGGRTGRRFGGHRLRFGGHGLRFGRHGLFFTPIVTFVIAQNIVLVIRDSTEEPGTVHRDKARLTSMTLSVASAVNTTCILRFNEENIIIIGFVKVKTSVIWIRIVH